VNLNITGRDVVRSKLILANTAKTYIADVTEFDWSFYRSVRCRQLV
jgi:hypothetical protein